MGVASFPHTAHTQESLVRPATRRWPTRSHRGGNHVTLAASASTRI